MSHDEEGQLEGSSNESLSTGRNLSHIMTSTFEVEQKDIILMQNESLETLQVKENFLMMQDIDTRTGYVRNNRRHSTDSGKGVRMRNKNFEETIGQLCRRIQNQRLMARD
ncbi:uncharacterized protein [Clytia hemisphaerica]|uniref:uncharacterized protein n=1 Tax=Clytia hemisphaerica TaxID=252671 RepID=UPI0034D68B1D